MTEPGAVVMDYPTAWAFVRASNPEDHDPACSYIEHDGAFLCDCDVLWDEYERRGGKRPPAADDESTDSTP